MLKRGFAALNAAILVALVSIATLPAPVQAAPPAHLPSLAGPLCPDIACVIYTGDAYGPAHPDQNGRALVNYPVFSTAMVRAIRASSDQPATSASPSTPPINVPNSGFVLDAFGGLHPYNSDVSAVLTPLVFPYFPGKDIARDLVFLPSGQLGGYELDGYGGIHPFSDTYPQRGPQPLPPSAGQFAYFPGRDVAIKMTLFSDGTGGYVLDAYGGIHPWSVGANPLPITPSQYAYWANLKIARDIWVDPASTPTSASGYVLDGYGGIHPFWGGTAPEPTAITAHPYFAAHDIARAMWFLPGSAASGASIGYELDGFGGIHPFASQGTAMPPALTDFAYWPGRDIAVGLLGGRGG